MESWENIFIIIVIGLLGYGAYAYALAEAATIVGTCIGALGGYLTRSVKDAIAK